MKTRKEHNASCRNSIKPKGSCYCVPDQPTKELGHTPTPWKLDKYADNSYSIYDATNRLVIYEIEKAKAAFVVRAVNAYKKDQEIKRELLAFLKEMKEAGGPITKLGWEQLNNLITKAEGK